MIDHNMAYEGFIRQVFDNCDRWGDPLRLANTDYNDSAGKSGDLTSIRLGVGYAMRRLMVRLEDELGDTGSDYQKAHDYSEEIIKDSKVSYARIHTMIEDGFRILKRFPPPN